MRNNNRKAIILLAGMLLLAACSPSDEAPAATEKAVEVESTIEPTVIIEPTAVPEPTATIKPTATPEPLPTEEVVTATIEPAELEEETVRDLLPGFAGYQAQNAEISLIHPEDWSVSEQDGVGILVESSEGFFDEMPEGEGALLIIIPRGSGAYGDQDMIEELRLAIGGFGPPPSVQIDQPITSNIMGQEAATAFFNDRTLPVEGLYAYITNGEEAVFVFSATSGEDRADFLSAIEAVVNSIELG